MNPVIRKLQVSFSQHSQAAAFLRRATALIQHPLQVQGSFAPGNERQYKTMPTHGIGRWRYLLPRERTRKKRDKHQMKPIKAATDTEYGSLNVIVSGFDMTVVEHYSQYIHNLCHRLGVRVDDSYALPTKSTEVMLMPEQGTKMYVDSLLKTHERVLQLRNLNATLSPVLMEVLLKNQPEGLLLSVKEHTVADYHARFKARPELEGLKAQMPVYTEYTG